jgi:hypothetical protein
VLCRLTNFNSWGTTAKIPNTETPVFLHSGFFDLMKVLYDAFASDALVTNPGLAGYTMWFTGELQTPMQKHTNTNACVASQATAVLRSVRHC